MHSQNSRPTNYIFKMQGVPEPNTARVSCFTSFTLQVRVSRVIVTLLPGSPAPLLSLHLGHVLLLVTICLLLGLTTTPVQADLGTNFSFVGTDRKNTRSVAWGDWDNDGDLDLAVGNFDDVNQVYENEGGSFSLVWESGEAKRTNSVAWGDWDGDGDLDLAVGNSAGFNDGGPQVYENEGGIFSPTPAWESLSATKHTMSVAWGDWDGDDDLDLAVGNSNQANQVYENEGGTLSPTPAWESGGQTTTSVAWGDWDGDGDLDLAVGNYIATGYSAGGPQVYVNEGGTLSPTPAWEAGGKTTFSVAWGDWDGDGDLDLAIGNSGINSGDVNQVYENTGGSLSLAWESTGDAKHTNSIAWGDWDGDGDLDLAVGNIGGGEANQVYENQGGSLSLAWESSGNTRFTSSVAWGDWDNDGDLDLAVGNCCGEVNQVYENEVGNLSPIPTWESTGTRPTFSVAWGDWDGDGDLDLAIGSTLGNQVYENEGGGLILDPANGFGWVSPEATNTWSVAWGDWDGDGDLDLAIGNVLGVNQVYENEGGGLILDPANGFGWVSSEAKPTNSIAWGDWDGDGDLDLAVGNRG